MTDKSAQVTIELSKSPEKTSQDATAGSPLLGRRIFGLRTTVPILLTLGVLYLVYRQVLGLNWGEVWTSVSGAHAGLLAFAFAIFYCSFSVRALRWEALLANVGYS